MDTNKHNKLGLFRNEIFISDTFIILLPSLNIYFTNVWKSKGRIRRIVLEMDIDFCAQYIWPSSKDFSLSLPPISFI